MGDASDPAQMQPLGVSRDLSRSGIFVVTDRRPALGSETHIGFVWGDDTLVTAARVMRHAPDGLALAFVDPSQDLLDAVDEIID